MSRVSGSSIKTVRDFYGKSQSNFAKMLGVSQPTMSKIEKGEKNLEETHFDHFNSSFNKNFFTDSVVLANQQLFYRKLSTISKSMLNQFESRINLINHFLNKSFDIVELEETILPQIDAEDYNLDIEFITTELRLKLGIGRGPIDDIVKTLEAAGILIHFFDFPFISAENKKFDGVSFYSQGVPVILINDKIPNSRKVFTIAHELGHLVMHFDHILTPERDIEKEANHFASSFLSPINDIKSSLRNLNMDKLQELKVEWNMSLSSLVYRAYTIKNISEQTLRFWMMKLAPIRKSEPLEFGLSRPRIIEQLINLVNEETNGEFFNSIGYTSDLVSELFNFRNQSRVKLKIV